MQIKFFIIMFFLIISLDAKDWCKSKKLNTTEQTICSNNQLKQLDKKLQKIYGSTKSKKQDYGQLNWLKSKRDSCFANVECIKIAYVNRISTLQERLNRNDITEARPWCSSNRLNTTELTICNSIKLRNLDAKLQIAYGQAKARNDDYGQNKWLIDRNLCGSDIYCIEQTYIQRIKTLKNRLNKYRIVSKNKTCSENKINELKAVCIIAAIGESKCADELYKKMPENSFSYAGASAICNAAVNHLQDGSIDPESLQLSAVSGFLSKTGDSMIDEGNTFFGVLFKMGSYTFTLASLNACFDKANELCYKK